MLKPLTLNEIVIVTQKPDLTQEEILQVLSSEIVQNDNLENIRLFNEWIRNYYDYHSSIHKTLELKNMEFRNIDLTKVDFRKVRFIECNFFSCKMKYANFSDSTFTKVLIWGANIESACFRGAEFVDTILDEIEPNGEVNFLETRFVQCRLSFTKLKNAHLDFTNSIIRNTIFTIPKGIREGGVSIVNPLGFGDGQIISDCNIRQFNLNYCHVESSKLINLTITSFIAQNASFYNCEFIDSKVEHSLNITGIIINNVRMNSDFFDVFCKNSTSCNYKECMAIYDNFKTIGDSSNRNKYYLLSRNLLGLNYRAEFLVSKWANRNKLVKYLLNRLHKYFWNYGESPFRVLAWSGLLIFIIALVILIFDLAKSTASPGDALYISDLTLDIALYFSAITFATVGYGDIVPVGFGRILLSFEGLLGPVMVTLFIVSLTKKMLD